MDNDNNGGVIVCDSPTILSCAHLISFTILRDNHEKCYREFMMQIYPSKVNTIYLMNLFANTKGYLP